MAEQSQDANQQLKPVLIDLAKTLLADKFGMGILVGIWLGMLAAVLLTVAGVWRVS